jgi:hypothetical protein
MAIDAGAAAVLRQLDEAEEGIWQSLEAAGRAYATGLRAKPLVDRHFTPGNDERYGFAPLSRAYFAAKQAGLVSHRGASHFLTHGERAGVERLKAKHAAALKAFRARRGDSSERAAEVADFRKAQGAANRAEMTAHLDRVLAGRQGSKLDAKAKFHATGPRGGVGIGVGKNLPTLVLTGALRQAVSGKNATLVVNRATGVLTITFHGLPEYALYLHEGTAKMPARSPVEPCADDIAQMREVARQFYADVVGKARGNPLAA